MNINTKSEFTTWIALMAGIVFFLCAGGALILHNLTLHRPF